LLRDPPRRRAIAAAAATTASRFDWSAIADEFDRVLSAAKAARR
jgi:hypothetical protein